MTGQRAALTLLVRALRQHRTGLGMSQESYGHRLGFDRRTVLRVEKQGQAPSEAYMGVWLRTFADDQAHDNVRQLWERVASGQGDDGAWPNAHPERGTVQDTQNANGRLEITPAQRQALGIAAEDSHPIRANSEHSSADYPMAQRPVLPVQDVNLNWETNDPGQDDAMHRANFLKLIAASGLVLTQGKGDLATSRALLVDVPSHALQSSGGNPFVLRGVPSLQREVEIAWHLRQASRYSALDNLLAYLIPDLDLATKSLTGDEQRTAYELLTHGYHAAVGMLKALGQYDLAMVAADRALRAAEHAEDRVLLAASVYRMANVSLASGRYSAAQEQALSAAARLEPQLNTPRSLAVWGGLLLTAVLAAASQNDRPTINSIMGRVRDGGERLGQDVGDLYTIFGPIVVATYDVKARIELGDGREALKQAATIPTHRLRPELIEQRTHHLIDVARCHAQCRDDVATVGILEQAERLAPEEVRGHPLVAGLVGELLGRERQSAVPRLRELAGRVGVLR